MSVSDDDVVLIIPPDQYFHSVLSNLSHLSHTVSLITSVLTPNQLELFKRSSIGRLIDTDLVFCGPLIHQILLREIKQPDQKIMQFLIGGEVITFSLRSFEEITGLKSTRNYRRHEFNPRLRRLLFDDRVKVPSKELDTKMKNHGLSDDGDVVKLALLCFIELVLLGNKITTLIDTSLLSILDDNESFENYDWAQLFFDKTLFGLSNALKERKCKTGEVVWKKAKSYSLYGFPFAFQVWIYETIPLIANMCARKINNRSMPPIGRWNCNKLIKMDMLERDIFSKDKIVVNEEIDFHMDELVETVTTEKVDRKRKILLHVKSGEEEKKHKRVEEEEKNKREEVMPKNEGEKSQKSKGLSSSCRTCIKRTDARVEHLEAEVRELRADMKVVLATLKNIEKNFCKLYMGSLFQSHLYSCCVTRPEDLIENKKELDKNWQRLSSRRNDIRRMIETETRMGRKQTDEVEVWMEAIEEMERKKEEIDENLRWLSENPGILIDKVLREVESMEVDGRTSMEIAANQVTNSGENSIMGIGGIGITNIDNRDSTITINYHNIML